MTQHTITGTVVFTVSTDWNNPQPPTHAQAVEALHSLGDAYADYEYNNITLHARTTTTHSLTPEENPLSIEDDITQNFAFNEPITYSIEATVNQEITTESNRDLTTFEPNDLWETIDEFAAETLSNAAPCSVLNIDTIENITITPDPR